MRHKLAPNVEWTDRYLTRLIFPGALCLFCCLTVVTLPARGQTVKSEPGAAAGVKEAHLRRLLAPALNMLKARDVPFDPNLLLSDDWRARLEPALARIPAMSETMRVTEPMKGVYLAGILLLPEHINLKGDTLILTRELAPDDENSTISITGDHQLFIFNIGDSRKFAAMLRSRSRSELLNIDVKASCSIIGIAPIYLGKMRCGGMGYWDWRLP